MWPRLVKFMARISLPTDFEVVQVERLQDGSGVVVERSASTGITRTREVHNARQYEK